MKLRFEPEDFRCDLLNQVVAPQYFAEMAKQANARLAELLNQCPVVVCRMDDGKWACDEHPGFARATHQARLVNIQKVEGEK